MKRASLVGRTGVAPRKMKVAVYEKRLIDSQRLVWAGQSTFVPDDAIVHLQMTTSCATSRLLVDPNQAHHLHTPARNPRPNETVLSLSCRDRRGLDLYLTGIRYDLSQSRIDHAAGGSFSGIGLVWRSFDLRDRRRGQLVQYRRC